MKTGYRQHFRRRREGKTNYKKRLQFLLSGMPRLVVRITNTRIIVQVAEAGSNGDKIIAEADSRELKKLGWKHGTKNIPSAYLTGVLAAKKAAAKKTSKAVPDIGLHTPSKGARAFAVLKGAVDGGLNMGLGKENLPSEDRLKGAHIEAYKKTKLAADIDKVKAKIEGVKVPAKKAEKKPVKKPAKKVKKK